MFFRGFLVTIIYFVSTCCRRKSPFPNWFFEFFLVMFLLWGRFTHSGLFFSTTILWGLCPCFFNFPSHVDVPESSFFQVDVWYSLFSICSSHAYVKITISFFPTCRRCKSTKFFDQFLQKIDQTRMKVSSSFFSVPQLFGLFLIPKNSKFFDLRRLQVVQKWGKNWIKNTSPRIWSRPCGAWQLGAKVRCRRAVAPGSVRHQTP